MVRCFSSQRSVTDDTELYSLTDAQGLKKHQQSQHSETQDTGTDSQSTGLHSESSFESSPCESTPVSNSTDSQDSYILADTVFVSGAVQQSSNMLDSLNTEDPSDLSQLTQEELEQLKDLPDPKPIQPSYNLAPYVAKSEVLQKLVGLGVDLSAVEKVSDAADFVVQANWDVDIQPRLLFLRDVGVDDSQLGHVLTKNPLLLKEDVEDMQMRIDYMHSKKFSKDEVSYIVKKAPLTLLLPVKYIDKKLGFLQTSFHLTGDEVRLVATKLPKIVPWKLQKLKDIRFYMKEMLGFSDKEQKAMLLATPRVYLSSKHQLGERFDFLCSTMGLTHRHLCAWPAVFRTRLHILKQRHRFLLLVGRAQYDPTQENYVSLKALVSGKDRDFCFHVAKASTAQFYNFLKTL
ncbi:hypothetical protein V1264_023144 [Littorina saxatilis]|uniref:Transcription termination factor 3, mitochondrial n=3 Tax=Littorina saxatilis TaxID=31220 RepID=A0AAN9B6F3_9CAEN